MQSRQVIGFTPFLVSLLMDLMGTITFFQATRRPSEPLPAGFIPSSDACVRIGAMTLAIAAMVLLTETVGFRLTTTAFLLFLLYTLGWQKWWLTAVISVGGGFGVYCAFSEWLQVPLPGGYWGSRRSGRRLARHRADEGAAILLPLVFALDPLPGIIVGTMFAFGWIGYIFRKLQIPVAPVALAYILGPLVDPRRGYGSTVGAA